MIGQILLIVCIIAIISPLNCLETSESSEGDAQIIKGILGQSALLPCRVDPSCGEVYFITWTKREKNDRWVRIYIFSNDNVLVDKPLKDLSGRAKFSLLKNEAQLIINQLKSGDESLYKCDVTYVEGKCPSLTFVRLDLIAKPSKASIEFRNSHVQNGSDIVGLVEGDQLRLTCVVNGGKPLPVVGWRRIDSMGNIKIIETKNTSISDNVTKVTLVSQLSRSDLKAKYECHVEHEAIIKNNSLDSHVLIDISVGALSIEIVGPVDDIKEGDIAVIQCIAFASKPLTNIIWKNGSHIIDSSAAKSELEINSDGTVTTRSFIELLVSRFDHHTTIECQAINIAMKQPLSQSIELRIQYSPIVVMEPQNGVIVNESADIANIYCTYISNPPELIENATWYRNDKELFIYNDTTHYISQLSGYPILTIVNPTRKDSGSYYCSIANSIGRGKPDTGVELNVLYPPVVNLQLYPNPAQGFTIKEGDDVRLICDIIDGNPLNATKFKWFKNHVELVSETSFKEIMWRDVERSLSANYSCIAISDAGISEISNNVYIDVSYLPSNAFIRQLNGINAIKGENLTLECIAHDLGRPRATEYLWQIDGEPIINETDAILNIFNVELKNRGNISCNAINEIGFGSTGVYELIPYAPPNIIDSLPLTSGALSNASHHNVSCRVECYPICAITWYKDQQIIDNSSSLYQIKNSIHPEEPSFNRFMSVVSTLIWNMSALSPLDRTQDSGLKYSCVSSDNDVGIGVQSQTTFYVQYKPENMRIRPELIYVNEYDIPPDILCESDALPEATYRWHSSFENFGVIADTPLLSFNGSIERERSGEYTCIASNLHGESRINVLINVLYAPTCLIYESDVANNEQDIVLICEVTSANPNNDLLFSWSFNDTKLNETLNTEIVKTEGQKSSVFIATSDDTLFGTWTCSVSNSVGFSEPNCTLHVSAPIIHNWSLLNDEFILLISSIIAALILTFIVIMLILICLMRRRRHKQDSHQVSQIRENPDGSRSPTPSSSSSHYSSNQVITYKKVELNPRLKRNDRVIDSSNGRALQKHVKDNNDQIPADSNKEMYENMPFQRKKCMLLSGAFIPQYENIAQITKELRRTQSARYHNYQPFGMDMDDVLYADMYDDVKAGKIKDPRIKPPIPPKGDASKAKPPKRPPKTKKAQ